MSGFAKSLYIFWDTLYNYMILYRADCVSLMAIMIIVQLLFVFSWKYISSNRGENMKKVGKVEKSKLSQMEIYTILRWGGSRYSFSKIYLILLILRWDKIPMHQLDMIWVFFGKGHREFINIVHLLIFLKLGPRGTGISKELLHLIKLPSVKNMHP